MSKSNLFCISHKHYQNSMNLKFLENIERSQFGKAAKELMQHHCIIKRDSRDGHEVLYSFAEIEFYLYEAGYPELDVDTYDRDCAEVEWFFHKSGVDIAFSTTSEGNELLTSSMRHPN